MKLDVKSIVIAILAIYIGFNFFFGTGEPIVEDKQVVIPEKVGKVEKKLDSVIRDTVYIPIKIPGKITPEKKEIVVDSVYKTKYEKAIKENDSLEAKNLFLESITLNTWEGNLVNNKDILISGKFLTRGKLLEYNVDYKIKSDTLTYTPEIYTNYPNFSLILGLDISPPITGAFAPENNPMVLSGKIGFQNGKGHSFTVSYGTDKRVTIGWAKSFKLSRR